MAARVRGGTLESRGVPPQLAEARRSFTHLASIGKRRKDALGLRVALCVQSQIGTSHWLRFRDVGAGKFSASNRPGKFTTYSLRTSRGTRGRCPPRQSGAASSISVLCHVKSNRILPIVFARLPMPPVQCEFQTPARSFAVAPALIGPATCDMVRWSVCRWDQQNCEETDTVLLSLSRNGSAVIVLALCRKGEPVTLERWRVPRRHSV